MKGQNFLILIFLFFFKVIVAQTPSFAWARVIGNVSYDRAHSIAVDNAGNVYTTGDFAGIVDFNPGSGIFNLASDGFRDIFISKLDASGNFIWAKRVGSSSGNDFGIAIDVDASGNTYTTGHFDGVADFNPNGATNFLTSAGGADCFILKLDPMGNFMWAKSMGGMSTEEPLLIDIDVMGNVITTGNYGDAADFDPSAGTNLLFGYGVFISKLDSSGNFIWAKGISNYMGIYSKSIASNSLGDIFIAGDFSDTADLNADAGINSLTSAGVSDVFILKLNASGNFVWARKMGGIDEDYSAAIKTDAVGNVYTVGYFYSTGDYDPGAAVFNLVNPGSSFNVFISKLNSSGNFVWAKSFAGIGQIRAFAMNIDQLDNIYTTGYVSGTIDFDPNAGVFNLNPTTTDIYIAKLSSSGTFAWAVSAAEGVYSFWDIAYGITTDLSNNIYIAGTYGSTSDFDPGIGVQNYTTAGFSDVFIVKLNQITSTGLEGLEQESSFILFPNPTSGIFKINGSGDVFVYNILGETVFSKQEANEQTEIDLSGSTPGIYFVKCYLNGKQSVQKIKLQ